MFGDLLLADFESLFFPALVYLLHPQIVLGGNAHHRAQGLYDGGVHHHMVAPAAVNYLKALGGLYNYLGPGLHLEAVGGKIIALAPIFKSYAYNFNQ